jgi:hypothetical protein
MFPGYSALARHATPFGAARNQPQAPADSEKWIKNLIAAERACCCPAKPTTVAVLPSRPGGAEPVDLLLCNHHYREAKTALAAAGAAIHRSPW